MYIFKLTAGETGQVGEGPRRNKLVTSDSLATITTANYLNKERVQPQVIYPNDFFDVTYDATSLTDGVNGVFTVSFSGSIPTLVEFVSPGDVTLPVVGGNFAVFDGTTGAIQDLGYLPSDATKTRVAMANGAMVANHLVVASDSTGTLAVDPVTAFNAGNIQAGVSGTPGYLASLPATASRGQFHVTAANSVGNTITEITHDSMGQATSFSFPDPGAATAKIGVFNSAVTTGGVVVANGTSGVLETLTAFPIAGESSTFAGGGTIFNIAKTGVTTNSIINANISTSSNDVAVSKVVCTADQIQIIFTADPGVGTVVKYSGWSESVN